MNSINPDPLELPASGNAKVMQLNECHCMYDCSCAHNTCIPLEADPYTACNVYCGNSTAKCWSACVVALNSLFVCFSSLRPTEGQQTKFCACKLP